VIKGNLAQQFIRRAEIAVADGDVGMAEELYAGALRSYGLETEERERIYERLADLARRQRQFRASSQWRLEALQSKSRRLHLADPEMKRAVQDYRISLETCLEAFSAGPGTDADVAQQPNYTELSSSH
jgi:hypothetical protein